MPDSKMAGQQYWKVLYDDYYKEGLNVEENIVIACMDARFAATFAHETTRIARVTIPDGARLSIKNGVTRSDRVILSDIVPTKKWHMWENYAFCSQAVKDSHHTLRYVGDFFTTDQYTQLCLESVRWNGDMLYCVKVGLVGERYAEICLEAVKRFGGSLRHVKGDLVKDRYVEICLEAVKKYPSALHYVRVELVGDRYKDICDTARDKGMFHYGPVLTDLS